MFNPFDEKQVEEASFSYHDLLGQDRWNSWAVTYSFATATSLTVVGRFKVVGRQCFWQVQSSGTSLATTAGTSYIALPIPAKGYSGIVNMYNATTNINVGTSGVDVTNSRAHLPSQIASANTFAFWGTYEV